MPLGTVPPIPVRETYRPGAVPTAYDAQWLRTQLGKLARAAWQPISITVRSAYTVTATDELLLGDATAGAFNITLLPPAQMQFARITIKKTDASANAITVVGTVDGIVNPTLTAQFQTMTIQCDGVAWWEITEASATVSTLIIPSISGGDPLSPVTGQIWLRTDL